MGKRFIETTIWTQNKWFRKLSPRYKLFWFYLLSNCDSVGVWEEDIELASFIVGVEYKLDDILKAFKDRIKYYDNKKFWIKDFCYFQYGELKEDNIKNKPHQSYIALLKKHRLWIDYTKSVKYPSKRVKDKETDKDKDFIYKVAVKVPKDIFLTDNFIKYARSKGINGSLDDIFESFVDFHQKHGNQYKDWYATWRTWTRKHIKLFPADVTQEQESLESLRAN